MMEAVETRPKIIFWFFAALMLARRSSWCTGRTWSTPRSLSWRRSSRRGVLRPPGGGLSRGAQALIYVGGILILLLFGVMLTNRIFDVNLRTETFQVVPSALVSAGILPC
jgi:NADH-quinone oxidoreductase subunit J